MNIRIRNILLPAALMLAACDAELGYFAKDRATAESGVAEFRQLYNEGKYADIYNLGSAEMKQAVTLEQFVRAARDSAAKLGRFKNARQAGASCFPNQVRLVYLAEFEKGEATEMMTWLVKHGKASLHMYSVSPGFVEVPNDHAAKCPS